MSKPFITYTAQVEKLKNEKDLVITDDDYDNEYVKQYRDFLFQRLSDHLSDSNIVILGYSLADEHIRNIITEVLRLSKNTRDNEIILFMYQRT